LPTKRSFWDGGKIFAELLAKPAKGEKATRSEISRKGEAYTAKPLVIKRSDSKPTDLENDQSRCGLSTAQSKAGKI